jgi:CheY-like chemotaxis protein
MEGESGWISPCPPEVPPSASLSLPTSDREQRASSVVREERGPVTVLLVEDNDADIFVIREVLSRCGIEFSLRVARDGEEALSFFKEIAAGNNCPGLLLLDLNVPKVPGVEVLRRLRGGSGCHRTPVVVVTSSDSETDRRAVASLGVDAYFRKPSDLTAYLSLANVIRKVLLAPGG